VPQSSSTMANMLHIWFCMALFLCIYLCFGSMLPVWVKTCSLCFSDPILIHLTWCPPIAFIYIQTTCHYSLWLCKTPLCIYTTISWSIHQL
jgi:hypothetical protein